MSGLEKLGREIAEALAQELSADTSSDAVRNRLLARRRTPTGLRAWWDAESWKSWRWIGAAAAVVALLWLRAYEAPLQFTLGNGDAEGTTNSAIHAFHDDYFLRFTDGSTVDLSANAQVRVRELTAWGAHIQLDTGKARINVEHSDNTRWSVVAGPYTVRVVGTHFEIDWNPDSRVFELQMHEGEVIIDGPAVVQRRVRGTGRLHLVPPAHSTESKVGGAAEMDGAEAARSDAVPGATSREQRGVRTPESPTGRTQRPSKTGVPEQTGGYVPRIGFLVKKAMQFLKMRRSQTPH